MQLLKLNAPIMQLHQVNEVFARTDIVVVGHNPENADYTNPRGEIYGYCGYVVACAPDGSQWIFNRNMTDVLEAVVLHRLETFVKHVQWQLENGRQLDPQFWTPTRPSYGSAAYANGGWDQLDAEEERLSEERSI